MAVVVVAAAAAAAAAATAAWDIGGFAVINFAVVVVVIIRPSLTICKVACLRAINRAKTSAKRKEHKILIFLVSHVLAHSSCTCQICISIKKTNSIHFKNATKKAHPLIPLRKSR